MSILSRRLLAMTLGWSLLSATASAQLLGGFALPNLPVVGPVLRGVTSGGSPQQEGAAAPIARTLDSLGVPDSFASLSDGSLLDLRRLRLGQLVRDNRATLDSDPQGNPVRRGELVTVDPDPASLAAARNAGFTVLRAETEAELGLTTVVLRTPARMSSREALKRLRAAAPDLAADYNHVFEPAGGALAATSATLAAGSGTSPLRIAMIDGGVANHPAFAGASIEQRAFTGRAKATGHGTAVASLLIGSDGRFRGAMPGAQLFVADVYGGDQAAGSADAVVRALAWAASKRPSVINVSLVGPSNLLMQRAIVALARRGIPIVAAVGNDGPAAPPQFPASFAGVIGATGVDAGDRALPEAGRSPSLAFAAPGADMAAALPGKGYARVRGTSFAAPLVAARLAATGSTELLAAETVRGKGKVGRGIVCRLCRVEPKLVGAK